MEKIDVSQEIYETIHDLTTKLNGHENNVYDHNDTIQILLTNLIPPRMVEL